MVGSGSGIIFRNPEMVPDPDSTANPTLLTQFKIVVLMQFYINLVKCVIDKLRYLSESRNGSLSGFDAKSLGTRYFVYC